MVRSWLQKFKVKRGVRARVMDVPLSDEDDKWIPTVEGEGWQFKGTGTN